uniref:Uncharacterized protein n=1 Tax=Fagus sylvatica TaxID=28930 RepID=A0A2N9G039_FAGSY
MHARYPKEVPFYPTCFKLFSDSSRKRSLEEFMPFEAKRYGSEDFQKFSSQGFFRGDAAWGICLYLRDLVVIRATNAGAGLEHVASYVVPQPLEQIFPSGKKISLGGDSSSQKFATAEISSDPLITLVDIVTDRVDADNAQLAEIAFDLRNQLMRSCQANLLQNAAFKKAKESVRLHTPTPQLPASSKQGTRTSTKRKTPEVEEIDLAFFTKDAKPSGRKLIKIVAKRATAKKLRVIEVTPNASIKEAKPLALDAEDRRITQEHEEAMQFVTIVEVKNKVEEAERKLLEAKEEDRRRKRKEEVDVEKTKQKEVEKKREEKKRKVEKVDVEKKKQEEKKEKEEKEEKEKKEKEAAREKVEKQKTQMVPKEKKRVEEVGEVAMMPEKGVRQPIIEAKALIEAVISSIEVATLLCQTPTKTSSIITSLKPTKEQLQAAINQLKEILRQPTNVILLDTGLVDQFQQVARFLIANPSALSESGKALLGLFVQNLDRTIFNLQADQEKRNQAISQEADHEQRVSRLQAH